eukprot:TRINITY_DN2428_c0_g1_i4.p1 TRINITY_DN2428_c0_g1~~TRINITY_DN2428_c0_g1_i4.p1  ORF type:complete len:111 (-),score=19.65 TRINITY_DN2428_c0_g1_i4:103-435(-)
MENIGDKPVVTARSLSMALCYINQYMETETTEKKLQPRILFISSSYDDPEQYIPFINCVYQSVRMKIPIDAIDLTDEESPMLAQASHLTKGIYIHPNHPTGFLQYLMVYY